MNKFNGRKMVFVVNGKPRAGKDTFAQILNEYLDVYKYSAVSKVKEIAKKIDKNAFIIVESAREVYGLGFKT